MRGHGRDDYPVRAMWNALLAGIVYQPECRVCARDTRRVDPSPTGLAQGDNLLSPGRPAPGRCSASSGAVGALGLRTTLRRMTLRRV
ncbi:hypothetical protein, partial [Thiorhodococcus minor]|uniref:hypothetical protein n=1 Tax=Thiorhodococcus minor TaxID=57489 RepID=UPI001ADC8B6F